MYVRTDRFFLFQRLCWMVDLSVEIGGIKLNNPVMPASGTYEFSEQHKGFFPPSELGALVTKTIFTEPRHGNPPPRVWETPCGLLNSIGIPSEGVENFINFKLPYLRKIGPPLIVSIAENTVESFIQLCKKVEDTGQADMLELDLSCPNIQKGTEWSADEATLYRIVKSIKESTSLPVIAKLSPLVSDIGGMAQCAEEAGADAVSMINTIKGMAININKRKPAMGNKTGGLSGPAIHPLAVYAVYSSYKKIKIPIIGVGGISSWKDAVELILAGATAVGVGMYNFINPSAMKEIISGIEKYLKDNGFKSVKDITGLAVD